MDDPILRAVKAAIERKQKQELERLAGGQLDLEKYKHTCGVLHGLEYVSGELNKIAKQLAAEEDADLDGGEIISMGARHGNR